MSRLSIVAGRWARWAAIAVCGPVLVLAGCGQEPEAQPPPRVVKVVPASPGAAGAHAKDKEKDKDKDKSEAEEEALPFEVPSGFVAERVAGPPLLKHPMFACFDDEGRLYVAGSSGEHLDAATRLKEPPDAIRRLEDTDGDGRFDKSIVFADRLTYPQGVLWHAGAVFVASPPSLWRLEDTDGDGKADRRQELLTGFPFTGIADDLHGPSLGPDGRIYWGVGRFPYEIHKPGGPAIRKGSAPLIMRCRTDGQEVEVYSAAMGNPVEVAFSPAGEPFACGTFLAPESQGQGLRDAIIHCVEGGVYSVRDHSGVVEEKQTGDRLPPLAHLGVAAGSGILYDHAGSLTGSRPTLLAAMFNLHKVQRFVLERDGASFRTRTTDFLVSDVPDFHPTDVLQDADGSILVVDTGGWFRDCPTSQIAKSNVMGGIYRFRRGGWDVGEDPRGRSLAWSDADSGALVARLGDARPAVRERAVDELARRGSEAVPALRKAERSRTSPGIRLHAIWALARIEGPEARAATRAALGDPDPRVRLAATTSAGLHRDGEAAPRLLTLLSSPDLAVRRQAATGLGRIGHADAVPRLLQALRNSRDRFLDHALIRALILLDDPGRTRPGLDDPNPRVRRGALIAMGQMDHDALTAEQVLPLLDPAEPDVQAAALRIIATRPGWAAQMVKPLGRWLAEGDHEPAQRNEFERILLSSSQVPEVQELIGKTLENKTTPTTTRMLLLATMARTPVTELPQTWHSALNAALRDQDPQVVHQAVSTVHSLGIEEFDTWLVQLAHNTALPDDLRIEAAAAAVPHLGRLEPDLFYYLTGFLGPEQLPLLRLEAARVLGKAEFSPNQLNALADRLFTADALILPRLLPAFTRAPSRALGLKIIASLERAPGLTALSPEQLRRAFESFPDDVRQAATTLTRRLEAPTADHAARLARLEPSLRRGNASRGHDVFFGTKAACSACHFIQGVGGHVGPDLSRIGEGRTGRDLLEAILYPSSSFARGYEPNVVATTDGKIYSGIIVRETADRICLVTSDRAEVYVPRAAIETIEPSRVSLMPQGLDANLSEQELADLVAYLRSLQ